MPLALVFIAATQPAASPSPHLIAAGYGHSLIVAADGAVWAFGSNGSGQLGDNTSTARRIPQVVPDVSNAVAVAVGSGHSLVLTSSGTVYAFGSNTVGQLGDGTTTVRRTAVPLSLSSVVAIAAGETHSLALLGTGEVYVWGQNTYGQLANGTTSSGASPTPVLLTTGAQAIAAGARHTLVVKTDGTVWGAGANTDGQLADGTTIQRTSLVQSIGLTNVARASGGFDHSVFLLADGTVWSAGANSSGQLGHGTVTTRQTTAAQVIGLADIASIDAGSVHTLAAGIDGSLWSWGENWYGSLGDGTNTNRSTATLVSGEGSVAVFSAGHRYSFVASPDGTVRAFGYNQGGELGNGAYGTLLSPTTISGPNFAWNVATPTFSVGSGTYSTDRSVAIAVVTPGATIHYTRDGAEPTEADPVVASGSSVPVTDSQTLTARAWKPGIPTGHSASETYTMQVASPSASPAGGTYTSARTVTLSTSTPGATIRYTLDGSIPTPSSPAYATALNIAITTTLKARAFKTNWSDSVVRADTYTMNFGTLTAPTMTPGPGTFTGEALITLTAQPYASIRYTLNGATPTTASLLYTGPFPMTATGTVRAKAFHPDYTASAVTTQAYTVVTSTPTFSLASGSYAPGTTITVGNPDAGVTHRWTLDGTDPTASSPVLPAGPLLVPDGPIKVRAFRDDAGDSAVASATYALTTPMSGGAVSAGDRHSLLATPEGMVYAWGSNSNSQLGDGTATARPTPVLVPTLTGVVRATAGALHSLAATYDGQLWAWGYNANGRLGDGTTTNRSRPVLIAGLPTVIDVAAGTAHSLALTNTGQVFAFGLGSSGQLGQGTTASSSVPVAVSGLTNVMAIAAGANHSLAVTAAGEVWAWGANGSNQVAPGATTDRLVPTLVAQVPDAVAVAAGSSHSVARRRDGSLWVWGSGASGKLGLGNLTNQPTPVPLPGVSAALAVLGTNHSAALGTNGTLLAWGGNGSGQVGDGTTASVLSPTAVTGPMGVTTMALGGTHSVAVAMDGGVWTWGAANYSQLGDGTTTARSSPVQAWIAPGRWSPPPPVLSLPTATYSSEQVVLVTSAAPGSTLRYTTTGVDPTESDVEVPVGGDVLISGTTTLKARAWVAGRPPSVVATATYTLRPAAPTMTPAEGTYVGPQSVTLSAADPFVAIRYTVDGSAPSESSTLYNASFSVPATATVQARAFRSGWTPSTVTSGALTIVNGTLATPTADPPGGVYQPAETVSLSGPSGATLRYTTDGSEPSAVSNVYMGPLTFTAGAVALKAKAFQTDWIESAALSEAYTFDDVPPTVRVDVFPYAINGWHSGPVTVTFVCADSSGMASCPTPTTVTADGDTTVSGTATDVAGNSTPASVTIHIDTTAPAVALTSPTADLTTTDTMLTLSGTVSDALSGLNLVQCNGDAATVTAGVATCTVPLRPGRNSLVLMARDAAGHVTSRGIRVTRTGVATTLSMTPATRTLLVEEDAVLSLQDDFGISVTAASWSTSDSAIVSLSSDDPPVVTAVASGVATITAAKAGLSAAAVITVAVGTSLADGTPLWTVPATQGTEERPPIYAHRVAETVPELFITEAVGGFGYEATHTVKATSANGSVLWAEAAPGFPVFADEDGGLVAAVGDDADGPTSLARFAGPPEASPWRYTSTGVINASGSWTYGGFTYGSRPNVAQAPDATIFLVETPNYFVSSPNLSIWDRRVVALDGATGAVRASTWLPRSIQQGIDHASGAPYEGPYPSHVVGPVVGEDGAAYIGYVTRQHTSYWTNLPNSQTSSWTVSLLRLDASGVTTTVPIWSFYCEGNQSTGRLDECTDGQVWSYPDLRQVVPDGVGGVLVRWTLVEQAPKPGGLYEYTRYGKLTRVVGGEATEFTLSDATASISLVGQAGNIYLESSGSLVTIDAQTGMEKWTFSQYGQPKVAAPDGGVVVHGITAGLAYSLDSTGSLQGTVPVPGYNPSYSVNHWLVTDNQGATMLAASVSDATRFRAEQGSASGQSGYRRPGVGIYLKSHEVVPPFDGDHVSIRIAPANMAWVLEYPDLFNHTDEFGNQFLTLGAGTEEGDSSATCDGILTKGTNRTNDWNDVLRPPQRMPQLPVKLDPASEGQAILSLLVKFGNYQNGLPYACFPELWHGAAYNSNSFAHGLLHAADIKHPEAPPRPRTPGWKTRVPLPKFTSP